MNIGTYKHLLNCLFKNNIYRENEFVNEFVFLNVSHVYKSSTVYIIVHKIEDNSW